MIAGTGSGSLLAIEGFGQDAGHRGFAHAPWTGEQIGVGYPLGGHSILQRLGNGPLPDDFLKNLGPPFSGQD
jgi:hypothetical protein